MRKHLILPAALSLAFVSCMKVDDTLKTNFSPTGGAGAASYCPANYVRVPALSPYTSSDFCVAKYEMKIQGDANGDQAYNAAFVAESRASGTPWVEIDRSQALAECQALGSRYDLMLNAEWQSVARNIEQVAWNWGVATIGSAGGISRTQGAVGGQAASADSDPCANTGNTCSLTTWDDHRRVHRLSNGEYIWDIGGNVGEWMKDDGGFDPGPTTISQVTATALKQFFGPSGNYSALNSEPYGGLGDLFDLALGGTVIRSGAWGPGPVGAVNGGIFAVDIEKAPTHTDPSEGFRCAYHPSASSGPETIFQSYILPDIAVEADLQDYDLGIQFSADVNGTISAVRFYRGAANGAGYTVSLWSNGGVLLGSGSGSDGTIPGWQEISLTTPVAITAGTTYVASYYTSNGSYPTITGGLSYSYRGVNHLTAPADGGVFQVGAGFPSSVYLHTNYLVDVVFTPDP